MANSQNKVVTKLLLSVDSSIHNRPGFIYAKQFDSKSRFIDVTLVNSNGIIPVSGMAQLNATRPDGEKIYVPGTINADFTISFSLKSQVLAIPGHVVCDVSVFGADGAEQVTLTSSTFSLIVAESQFSADAWEGDDDTNLFTETISVVAGYVQNAQAAANDASASRAQAQAAETNAKTSEDSAKVAAQAAAKSLEEVESSIQETGELIDNAQRAVDEVTVIRDDIISRGNEAQQYAEDARETLVSVKELEESARDSANQAGQHEITVLEAEARINEIGANIVEQTAIAQSSAEQAANKLLEIKEAQDDIESKLFEIKEEVAVVDALVITATSAASESSSARDDAIGYRNDTKDYADQALAARDSAVRSVEDVQASASEAKVYAANALVSAQNAEKSAIHSEEKATEAKESVEQVNVVLSDVQRIAAEIDADVLHVDEMVAQADESAAKAAMSEFNAQAHADTIQVTVDTLRDDYQAVIEEVSVLRERIMDATINPDDLGFEYDGSTGYLYPVYMGTRGKNGWHVADIYDTATLEDTQNYLNR